MVHAKPRLDPSFVRARIQGPERVILEPLAFMMASSVSLRNDDPLLGRVLAGKLEVLSLLGRGAMGKVYRAHHRGLDKPVAIKVLQRLEGPEEPHILRFRAEARAASRLDHPNSVQILDFGEEEADGLLYIAMELLEGIDLQSVLQKEEHLSVQRIAWIMAQTFSALAAAHAKGVIHRDMKPGNIMLIDKINEDGRLKDFVKVCDFGLAKLIEGDGHRPLTRQGAVFGTPAYMSPEQARGIPIDARADIYSCGVVMYKMITGRTPFRAETPTGVLTQHITDQPPPLESWGVPVDPRLAAVVQRAMQKDREDRYADAREARDALREILRQDGLDVPSVTGSSTLPLADATRLNTPRPETQTPTRPERRPSFSETLEEATVASPPVRAHSQVATKYGDTAMMATLAGQASIDPITRELPPPRSINTTLALIPGAIALIALGLLAAQVWRKNEAPPPPPVVAPAPPPQQAVLPVIPAPTSENEVSTPKNEVVDTKIVAPAARPRRLEKRIDTEKEATPAPNPVVERPAPNVTEPPPELKPSPVAPPTAPQPKATPRQVELTQLEVDGGVSTQRVREGLERHLQAATACLASIPLADSGEVVVSAEVGATGRLAQITASAGQDCLMRAFAPTRVQASDTGTSRVRFRLKHQALPQ